jgi:hypothetical protein
MRFKPLDREAVLKSTTYGIDVSLHGSGKTSRRRTLSGGVHRDWRDLKMIHCRYK